MNDFESRLRSLNFREPPPGWRASMVSTVEPSRGWRTWLAPHPAAWAALAAIWVVLAIVSQSFEQRPSSASAATADLKVDPPSAPTLLALRLRAEADALPPL